MTLLSNSGNSYIKISKSGFGELPFIRRLLLKQQAGSETDVMPRTSRRRVEEYSVFRIYLDVIGNQILKPSVEPVIAG